LVLFAPKCLLMSEVNANFNTFHKECDKYGPELETIAHAPVELLQSEMKRLRKQMPNPNTK